MALAFVTFERSEIKKITVVFAPFLNQKVLLQVMPSKFLGVHVRRKLKEK